MTTQQLEKLLADARQEAENNPKLAAILGSVEKWDGIGYGITFDHGSADCPLCKLRRECKGCPIARHVGEERCLGTPYQNFGVCDFDSDGCATIFEVTPGNGYTICSSCCDAIDGMLDLLLDVTQENM